MSTIEYTHIISYMEVIFLIEIFKALSDENRMRLFHLLSQKAFCVCELEVLLEMNQSNVSRHLNKLRLAGLITPLKEGLWVHYQISDAFKANNPELFCYLEKHWVQENIFERDLEKYHKYKNMGLSCKDITEDKEKVLVAIQ